MTLDNKHFKTVILGAGFGGLGVGAQLAKAKDFDFVIIERKDQLGGVWRDNAYPGAACDTESHLYCYSFFPHLQVSRMYAGRDELLHYMENLAEHYQLYDHLIFNTEIIKAEWDNNLQLWKFTLHDNTCFTSTFFIPAWGQLNQPSIPKIKGIEKYRGVYFHSAKWNSDVDLRNKLVASIGNAASAVQYVPEIAHEVRKLSVFQRSANWIMPRNQVIFNDQQLMQFRDDPEKFFRSRRELHAFREAGFARTQLDTIAQQEGKAQALAHLTAQVPDPQLRKKLTPDYEFGCKRILRSDDFFPALCRDNVTLETRPIRCFYEDGIITEDDKQHPFDVVIFGTGFHSQAFQGNLKIYGKHNRELGETWQQGPEAYLGITVPQFPNMFMIYGPNTNLNHNSIITMLEIQQNYILNAISYAERKKVSLTVRPEVFTKYNQQLQNEMHKSAFSADCSSWYKNASGKVINNWSGTVNSYADMTHWNAEDYHVEKQHGSE